MPHKVMFMTGKIPQNTNKSQHRQILLWNSLTVVKLTIGTLKGGKTPGPDGFGPEFDKTLDLDTHRI